MPEKTATPIGAGKLASTLFAFVLSALAGHSQGATIFMPNGHAGEIFVANAQTGVIGKYSSTGKPITPRLITGLGNVEGIALDGDGYLYVTDTGSIRKYTLSGRPVRTALISGLCDPWAIALDGNGHLFVANYCGSIGEYTTSGKTINASLISGLPQLTGLTVQGTNLFVSIYGDAPSWIGSIGQFTTSGATINSNFIPNLQGSWGLLINPQGHLFVANNTFGTISEYDGTNLVDQVSTESALTAMAFHANGNILVANDSGDAIAEYTPSGTVVNTALISNFNGPRAVIQGPRGVAVALPPSAAVINEGDQNVTAGSTFSYSVTCSGSAPFKYEWFRDNHRIQNGNTSTLTLNNVSARDIGTYTVRVRNTFGRTVSAPVALDVVFPVPFNDSQP